MAGSSHEASGLPCQDASLCDTVVDGDGRESLVACVCDGAGSARWAGLGSKEVCEAALEFGRRFVVESAATADEATWRAAAHEFLEGLHRQLDERAEGMGVDRRDFATTLLLAVVGEETAFYLQVGDGAIVVRARESTEWSHVFWPQLGEFLNTTRFVTDADVLEVAMVERRDARIADVSLFSDGLERLLLHFHTRTVHAPFFERMFPALWAAQDESSAALRDRLAVGLAKYLRSDIVRRHADDDLSLILATLREEPLAPLSEEPPVPAED